MSTGLYTIQLVALHVRGLAVEYTGRWNFTLSANNAVRYLDELEGMSIANKYVDSAPFKLYLRLRYFRVMIPSCCHALIFLLCMQVI
jgi:hypothetical protein